VLYASSVIRRVRRRDHRRDDPLSARGQTWVLRNLAHEDTERLSYEAVGLYIWVISRATEGDPLSRIIVSNYAERLAGCLYRLLQSAPESPISEESDSDQYSPAEEVNIAVFVCVYIICTTFRVESLIFFRRVRGFLLCFGSVEQRELGYSELCSAIGYEGKILHRGC